MKGKRVLVSGGSGFIASHLCRRLVDEGADLTVLVKYNSVIDNVRLVGIWDRINVIESDLRNPDSLKPLSDIRPEIIYHMAPDRSLRRDLSGARDRLYTPWLRV